MWYSLLYLHGTVFSGLKPWFITWFNSQGLCKCHRNSVRIMSMSFNQSVQGKTKQEPGFCVRREWEMSQWTFNSSPVEVQ